MHSVRHFCLLGLLILTGCGTQSRNAVPADLIHEAVVPGFEDVRTFLDKEDPQFIERFAASFSDEDPTAYPPDSTGLRRYPVLALSGGGAGGAYSAGVLSGWSASGKRPHFKIITGVSTGAIIAPFAFAGQNYDAALKELYTTLEIGDVLREKSPLFAFFGNALASAEPLFERIRGYYDEEFVRAVAQEHRRGRRLYIGTANLDAQRMVIWDLGAIAASGREDAVELFRNVVFASSSIPGLVPPIILDVMANGESFDEMHVDGGVTNQVFLPHTVIKFFRGATPDHGVETSNRRLQVYAIRNGLFAPKWNEIDNRLMDITNRSIETFVMNQTMGDIYRLYAIAKEKEVDFYLGNIPDDYEPLSSLITGTENMKGLYELGYKEALNGYPWRHVPPQWELSDLPKTHEIADR